MSQADLFTKTKFVGWFRIKGQRWTKATEGETESEAFQALLRHADEVKAVASDLLVLPAGEKP